MPLPQEPRISTREAAEYLGLSKQRVTAKIAAGHFSGVSPCECGLTTMLPLAEVTREMQTGRVTRNKKRK